MYVKKSLGQESSVGRTQFANIINDCSSCYSCVWGPVSDDTVEDVVSNIWMFNNTYIVDWITQFPLSDLVSSIFSISLEFRINSVLSQNVTTYKRQDRREALLLHPVYQSLFFTVVCGQESRTAHEIFPQYLIKKNKTQE